MTVLLSYLEAEPTRIQTATRDPRDIASRLGRHDVLFEQWSRTEVASEGAHESDESILRTYARDIERLKSAGGYRSQDVVRMQRDPHDAEWQVKARTARGKFLEEHRHAEDEVRFFAAGSGLFSLRLGGQVFQVLCEQGDLLSVPAGTRHWFDMGSEPSFCALRLFGSPDGWVASFSGDSIARGFPSHDEVVARWL